MTIAMVLVLLLLLAVVTSPMSQVLAKVRLGRDTSNSPHLSKPMIFNYS